MKICFFKEFGEVVKVWFGVSNVDWCNLRRFFRGGDIWVRFFRK